MRHMTGQSMRHMTSLFEPVLSTLNNAGPEHIPLEHGAYACLYVHADLFSIFSFKSLGTRLYFVRFAACDTGNFHFCI